MTEETDKVETLTNIVQWQQASIDAMVEAIQYAERRNWSMFILGLIAGFSVGYFV